MAPFRTTTEAHKHKMATNFFGKGGSKLDDPPGYIRLIFFVERGDTKMAESCMAVAVGPAPW